MTLVYKPIQNNVENKDRVKTWRPILVKTGRAADSNEVCSLVSKRASLHKSDVQACFRVMPEVLNEILLNGRSVRLDGFGTFTIIAKSAGKGVEKEEDVSEKQITGLRCIFTPESTRTPFGGTTRALYEGVSFMHVNQVRFGSPSSATKDDDGDGDDDGGFVDPIG